jgi:hypothetical protein
MIEEIISPDLALQRKRDEATARRFVVLKRFKIGDRVQAGITGKPGILEASADDGHVSIRWPDGSLISGVDATELLPACEITVEKEEEHDGPGLNYVYDGVKCMGYLTDADGGFSLYFTCTLPINDQIKVLLALKAYLETNPAN